MRETKLILLEGVPGSGKSTLAQALLRRLAHQGIPATWWYEEDEGHPLYIFHDQASLQEVVADLSSGRHHRVIARALDKWRQVVEPLQSLEGVVLLDSTLFGYLTWSLFPVEAPEADTLTYLAAVERIVAPIDPCLIYLYQDDLVGSLRRVCDSRGADIEGAYIRGVTESPYGKKRGLRGFEGLVRYWAAYRALTDAAFATITYPKVAIDTSAGAWEAYQRRALDFLGLPPADADDETSPPGHPERFAGLYRSVDGEPSIVCTVSLEDGGLLLDGVPEVWPRSRLVPTSPSTFDVASLPLRVTFEEDGAGAVAALRVAGPELLGGHVSGVYKRERDEPGAIG